MGSLCVRHFLLFSFATLLFITGCDQAGEIPDFVKIDSVNERKKSFFRYLRPIVESENERVLKQRELLLELYDRHRQDPLSVWRYAKWLDALRAEYKVQDRSVDERYAWETLLRRIDMVPTDLALVQGAIESGWGTSRFARAGNSLFGQWCFVEGCGLVPDDRVPGARHEVARFRSPRDAVRSYIHNLNTHAAYRRFRQLRFEQREAGGIPDGYSLIQGLPGYSERSEAYLDEIRDLFLVNRRLLEL